MAKRFVPVLFFCAVVLLASCGEAASRRGASSYRGLEELDGYVAARPVYETRKRDQLEGIRKLAASTRSNRRLFDYGLYAANEYFSYSFDSTQFYLKQCLDLAESIGDRDRYNQASILLGHLYAKSGHYMEAYNRLFGQIDTNTLSEPLREEYLWTLYDFSRDLAGNSGMVERPPIQERDVYRQQLYKLIAKDSRHWRELRLDELASAGRLESADSLCRVMLASVDPAEHTYAIYAYEMSVIAEQQGRPVERMDWLIKSARSFMPFAASSFNAASTLRSVSPSLRRLDMSSAVWSNDSCKSAISLSNLRFALASAVLMRRSAVASASASRPSRSAIRSRSLSFFDFS